MAAAARSVWVALGINDSSYRTVPRSLSPSPSLRLSFANPHSVPLPLYPSLTFALYLPLYPPLTLSLSLSV